MTITEVLQLVDELLLKHTGKHLNDLQKNAISGLLQGQSYVEIADKFGYNSDNHIGNVCRELYQIFSKELGEKVIKSNFCVSVERLSNSFNQKILGIGITNNVNWCTNENNNQNKEVNDQQEINPKATYFDLKEAPKLIDFHNRVTELLLLSQWLEQTNTNLIAITGMVGIGKTTLARKLVDMNAHFFDIVIWKDINFYQSLDSLISQVLTNSETETPDTSKVFINSEIYKFLDFLCQKKCLIIFDNLESIFSSQKFSGQYKPEHENYRTFLKMIREREHQSCLVVVSQEKCQEMLVLDQKSNSNYCLDLLCLEDYADQILQNQNLKNQEYWSHLIKLYQGNPKYLQDISMLIKEVFDGEIVEFLQEEKMSLTEDMKSDFNSIWQKLSDIEKAIVLETSNRDISIFINKLKHRLSLSLTDISNGLQSLIRRFLLDYVPDNHKLFKLYSIFREYIRIEHGNIR